MSRSACQPPFTITIGSTAFVCSEGRITTAINAPDVATGLIGGDHTPVSPVDWAAPARVTIGDSLLTSGHVVEAVPTAEGGIHWEAQSALMLSENRMPPMVLQNLAPSEVVYAAAREAGFKRDQMRISGLDDIASEAMWVLAPIRGVEVDHITRVGPVEFLDQSSGMEVLRGFNPPLDRSLIVSFEAAQAVARVAVVGSLMYDVEQDGTRLLDTAAAWLTTRVRYAWSHLPDGMPQHYRRNDTRVEIARDDGVCVISIDGARRWWRGTVIGSGNQAITLSPSSSWAEPALPDRLSQADRDALLAIHRAVRERDAVQRVAAFWEAVEFYVGGLASKRLFGPEEIAAIVERSTVGVSDAQAKRITELLGSLLNSESLMTKFNRALEQDGVPVTSDDRAVLRRLRTQRNRAVHGAETAPTHADLDQAVAFLSRAVIMRLARIDGS